MCDHSDPSFAFGVELAMKWIIMMYGGGGVGTTEHHGLLDLWKQCRAIIETTGPDDGGIEVVEKLIKEFHDTDKGALAFRYSRNKNGALIKLPDGIIDLENLSDVMEGIEGFFTGA